MKEGKKEGIDYWMEEEKVEEKIYRPNIYREGHQIIQPVGAEGGCLLSKLSICPSWSTQLEYIKKKDSVPNL